MMTNIAMWEKDNRVFGFAPNPRKKSLTSALVDVIKDAVKTRYESSNISAIFASQLNLTYVPETVDEVLERLDLDRSNPKVSHFYQLVEKVKALHPGETILTATLDAGGFVTSNCWVFDVYGDLLPCADMTGIWLSVNGERHYWFSSSLPGCTLEQYQSRSKEYPSFKPLD